MLDAIACKQEMPCKQDIGVQPLALLLKTQSPGSLARGAEAKDRTMKNYMDGGEAILEAFRKLKIDYILSSPGSEWSPVWEALVRPRTARRQHGDRLHADDRPAAGGAGPCRHRPPARLDGCARRAAIGSPDDRDVGRVQYAGRGSGAADRAGMVRRLERRRQPGLRA